jgi:hypothetical protein
MGNGDERDRWDKADITSKWFIPVVVALTTVGFNWMTSKREASQKRFEIAVGILRAEPDPKKPNLRIWAVKTFTDETNVDPEVQAEIKNGAIPTTTPTQAPSSGQARLSIIRLQGSGTDASDKLSQALPSGSFSRITSREAPADAFPSQSEVRYYYAADKQSAEALIETIKQTLNLQVFPNNRTGDPGVSSHRPGDLNVYLR